ncbi:MAG: PhoH family protein [Clostridia bacterium]|nr:PhoH family protein [Clostridia bacterium]MBR2875084.1 PhoH family protein [Clostridia bacterium]
MEQLKIKNKIEIEVDGDKVVKLFGTHDENVEIIKSELDVDIRQSENGITLEGVPESIEVAKSVILNLLTVVAKNEYIDRSKIRYCIALAREGMAEEISDIMKGVIAITQRGKQIKCKTFGQKSYVEAIKKNKVVFGIGPAGTGKTYLAVALACVAYKNKEIERIILTRPAVEAGEKLGFLPGDLQEKIDPYLRPLYDALAEMFGFEGYHKLIEKGVIEVAPLAYMRGRTLSEAFIILDEAQNTTKEQMKMFLTRMGEGSKMVITGDITQVDLPEGKQSGLVHASKILKDIDDIKIINFTAKDVVRHELVMNIIKAYEKYENKQKEKNQ